MEQGATDPAFAAGIEPIETHPELRRSPSSNRSPLPWDYLVRLAPSLAATPDEARWLTSYGLRPPD